MIYKKFILFIFALIFWSNNLDAATPLNIKLSNGFEVVLIENHQNPVISCVVTVKAGSYYEDFTNSGVSHMLEHLLFNGTEKRTQEKLYKEIDFYGIYNNAHTDTDYTNYIVLAEKSNIEKALDIQSDMLFNSTFPKDKFEKEKGIIINEIARDTSEPSSLENEFFNLRFFYGTPYNLPAIGIPETIKNMTREQVKEYYERYYVPNNMTAIIMGDFNSKEMLRLVKRYFGKYPPQKLPTENHHRIQQSDLSYQLSASSISHSSITLGIPLPGIENPDFYGMLIIAQFLDADLQERVNSNLKSNNKGEVFNISVNIDFNKHFSFLKISISSPLGSNVEDIKKATLEEINKFTNEPINEEERRGVIVSTKTQEISLSEKPHYYGMVKGKFIAAGGWDFAKNYISKLEKVSVPQLEDIAKRYLLNPAFMTSLITSGEEGIETVREKMKKDYYLKEESANGEKIFTEESIKLVNEWKKKIQKTEVRRQKSEDKQKTKKRGEIKKVTFKNGLTLIVNSNKDSEVFAVHLLAKNRSLMEPEGKTGIVDFIHRIMERGTEIADYKTFQKELSAIGVTLKTRDSEFIPYDDFYTTHEYSYLRLETIDEYYDKGIEILANLITNPRFENEDIEFVRTEMLNLIKREDSKADTLSKKLFFEEVFKGFPQSKAISGTSETINSITKEDLENFHKIYFSPDNLIITVATGIGADEAIKKIHRFLGNREKRAIELPAIDFSRFIVKETPNTPLSINRDLKTRQSYLRIGKLIKIDPVDMAALRLLGYIFSERMAFELRERQGLAYSIGAWFSLYDETHALFVAAMGTTPDTVEMARDGILKEIKNFKQVEIKEEDLKRVVNKYIAGELMRGLSSINRCYYMGVAEFYKKDVDYHNKLSAELKRVKLTDMKRAKEKYLSVDNLIEVVVK
jgi:predicted Zn-dependent peptidase